MCRISGGGSPSFGSPYRFSGENPFANSSAAALQTQAADSLNGSIADKEKQLKEAEKKQQEGNGSAEDVEARKSELAQLMQQQKALRDSAAQSLSQASMGQAEDGAGMSGLGGDGGGGGSGSGSSGGGGMMPPMSPSKSSGGGGGGSGGNSSPSSSSDKSAPATTNNKSDSSSSTSDKNASAEENNQVIQDLEKAINTPVRSTESATTGSAAKDPLDLSDLLPSQSSAEARPPSSLGGETSAGANTSIGGSSSTAAKATNSTSASAAKGATNVNDDPFVKIRDALTTRTPATQKRAIRYVR